MNKAEMNDLVGKAIRDWCRHEGLTRHKVARSGIADSVPWLASEAASLAMAPSELLIEMVTSIVSDPPERPGSQDERARRAVTVALNLAPDTTNRPLLGDRQHDLAAKMHVSPKTIERATRDGQDWLTLCLVERLTNPLVDDLVSSGPAPRFRVRSWLCEQRLDERGYASRQTIAMEIVPNTEDMEWIVLTHRYPLVSGDYAVAPISWISEGSLEERSDHPETFLATKVHFPEAHERGVPFTLQFERVYDPDRPARRQIKLESAVPVYSVRFVLRCPLTETFSRVWHSGDNQLAMAAPRPYGADRAIPVAPGSHQVDWHTSLTGPGRAVCIQWELAAAPTADQPA